MTFEEWKKNPPKKSFQHKEKKKKLIRQKLMGAALIGTTVFILVPISEDITVCLVTVPLGLVLLCGKKVIIY